MTGTILGANRVDSFRPGDNSSYSHMRNILTNNIYTVKCSRVDSSRPGTIAATHI